MSFEEHFLQGLGLARPVLRGSYQHDASHTRLPAERFQEVDIEATIDEPPEQRHGSPQSGQRERHLRRSALAGPMGQIDAVGDYLCITAELSQVVRKGVA